VIWSMKCRAIHRNSLQRTELCVRDLLDLSNRAYVNLRAVAKEGSRLDALTKRYNSK
jgi:hypothetical protein